jgi:hypothetical protein
MRPRALTTMPWSLAHARMLPLRPRLAAVRPPPLTLASPGLAGMFDERREFAANTAAFRLVGGSLSALIH